MSAKREANTEPIAEYSVPYRGTWQSVAANQLAGDALYESRNVFLREGKLRGRPGLALLRPRVFDSEIISGGVAVLPTGKKLLAISKNTIYSLMSSYVDWQVHSAATIASNDESQVDIAFSDFSGTQTGIIANGETVLKQWTDSGGVAAITVSAGSLPVASSVCIAARRVVTLTKPYTINWTPTLDYTSWLATNVNRLAATPDDGICVRSLSKNTFVVYKERSIYLARAQAGDDSQAFSFSEPLTIEGPAGLHSVVQANDTHYWMTASGRVALFNGTSSPQWIADGLWIRLQTEIDPEYSYKIRAIYDYRLHTLLFLYPKIGDSGRLYNGLFINMPLMGSGVEDHACFLVDFMKPISFGYEMFFSREASRSILFTSTINDKQSFSFDETAEDDDGLQFDCMMQTPILSLPEAQHHMCNVELFLERANGNGTVAVTPVVSDMLENKTGSYDDNQREVINLNFSSPQEYYGFAVHSRFFGLRLQWKSQSNVHYAGAVAYGRVTSA